MAVPALTPVAAQGRCLPPAAGCGPSLIQAAILSGPTPCTHACQHHPEVHPADNPQPGSLVLPGSPRLGAGPVHKSGEARVAGKSAGRVARGGRWRPGPSPGHRSSFRADRGRGTISPPLGGRSRGPDICPVAVRHTTRAGEMSAAFPQPVGQNPPCTLFGPRGILFPRSSGLQTRLQGITPNTPTQGPSTRFGSETVWRKPSLQRPLASRAELFQGGG